MWVTMETGFINRGFRRYFRRVAGVYQRIGIVFQARGIGRERNPAGHSAQKNLEWIRKTGAGDEIRTHDPNLGKVVLYP